MNMALFPTLPHETAAYRHLPLNSGVFMKNIALTLVALTATFAAASANADTFTYYASGSTETQSIAAANAQGRAQCRAIGYSGADVEVVYTYFNAGGWHAYAIATCF